MKTVRFGIIGCGTMGREFASAAARWFHLTEMDVRPEIVALCNRTPQKMEWFREHCPAVTQATTDYRELLANPEVDAVYIAVPHNLHEETYVAAIEAGKHLMGEKPFGIDLEANVVINNAIDRHPEVYVRCVSQFPYFPGVQRIGRMLEEEAFGRILEVSAGFLHSSDLNPKKPINWKRKITINGAYGCMGDLGMHVLHMPFRAGWYPRDVRAVLSNIVAERPDGSGGVSSCETWDNATLFCTVPAADNAEPYEFPMTLKTHRIAPGEKNNWYIEILGTTASARWSSKQANSLEVLEYAGGEQAWQVIDMGHEMTHPVITPGIMQSGASDAFLQMWASFLYEMEHDTPRAKFAGCVTPEEAAASHRLFTAALRSQAERAVVSLDDV
jgi:predicted dehydrogenase